MFSPEGDKHTVDVYPPLLWQNLEKRTFGLFRLLGSNKSKPVGNAVYVRIHTDSGLSKSKSQNEIRALSTDTVESE